MNPRLFIDTNVILDLLAERDPFYLSTAQLTTLADKGKITFVVSPISFATVNYFLSKFETPEIAQEKLRKFRIICEISTLDGQIVEKGLNCFFPDFEDALQYYSAIDSDCQFIITRNGKDFKKSVIPIMTAEEYLYSIRGTSK